MRSEDGSRFEAQIQPCRGADATWTADSWTADAEKAFLTLIDAIVSAPALAVAKPEQPRTQMAELAPERNAFAPHRNGESYR